MSDFKEEQIQQIDQFEKNLKDLVEHPDLAEIAQIVVNLLTENAQQIQTNVMQAVLLNTVVEILVEKDITDVDTFMKQYQANLTVADEALTKNFSEAIEKQKELEKANKEEENDS